MKEGTLCKCIADFTGVVPGEINLYKNDLVQVRKIIDKLWLEGEGGGNHGRFPASIVVEYKIPSHPPNTNLYVAYADFHPQQEGDLPLVKNDFVVGINSVNQDWGYGESCGSKGVFPFNYVWKIDECLSENDEDKQNSVDLVARVVRNIEAQLPEELSLRVGDIVRIFCVIDDHWYKGATSNKEGIFPSSFVEIIDKDELERSDIPERVNGTKETGHFSEFDLLSDTVAEPQYSAKSTEMDHQIISNNENVDNFGDTDFKYQNTLSEDVFGDDYFKLNMPGLYTKSSDSQSSFHPPNLRDFSSGPKVQNLIEYESPQDKMFSTLSTEIDDYLNDTLFDSTHHNKNRIHEDLLDIDLAGTYTEDNTGIDPYGRAAFSFSAQYFNELSFKKGDIIHLICHIDSHWTLGKLGLSKGIFPTSYIDIIVDCPFKDVDMFEKRLDAITLKKAIVCFDYHATESGDASAVEGDLVLITKFVSNDWVEVETVDGQTGLFPISYLNILTDESSETTEITETTTISFKREYDKSDFKSTNSTDVQSELSKNMDDLNISLKHSKPIVNNTKEVVSKADFKSNISETNEVSKSEEVSTRLPKAPPPLPPRSSQTKLSEPSETLQATNSSTHSISSSGQEFALDIKATSSSSLKEADVGTDHSPRRPVPPRPSSDLNQSFEPEVSSDNCEKEVREHKEESRKEEPVSEMSRERPGSQKRLYLRREAISELVTTEHEYIHDLESLIQVVRLAKARKEADSVDIKVLMGNIQQVVDISKKFVKELGGVSFNEDEDVMVGAVFVKMSDEMCSVYKVYSSNNSVFVGPLLDKYQQGAELSFLNWVLGELRQHKINLLDMRAVLIKPVQRVLKYPLFIDNLVQNTPPEHPDYKNLEEAKAKMLNVAKEVNEYTKRIDLVNKYRRSNQQSFGEKIQRVSMHSMAKKGSRLRTRISATMGFINKTKDLRFEEEEAKFRALVKATTVVLDMGLRLVDVAKERHGAELGIVEAIAAALREASRVNQLEELRTLCRDVCTRIVVNFESFVSRRVLEPLKVLQEMCSAPEHLIQKRKDKLLDFDTVQRKFDKNKDASKTRILEEEMNRARGVYEALNKQLVMDLPVLNEHGIQVLALALESLITARMNLEGRVADLYLKLTQNPSFHYLKNSEYQKVFCSELNESTMALKPLSFVPVDFMSKSPRFGRRKSSFLSIVKRDTTRKRRSADKAPTTECSGLAEYDPSQLFRVCSDHTAADPFELTLTQGSVVAVIKNKDPSGSSNRWFVDSGSEKGFVRSDLLRPCEETHSPQLPSSNPERNSVPARPSPPPSLETSTRSSQPQSHSIRLNRSKPRAPLPSSSGSNETPSSASQTAQPPKYEDLYPDCQAQAGRGDEVSGNNVYEEVNKEAHRYEFIEEDVSDEDEAQGGTAAPKIYFQQPDMSQPQFFYALYAFNASDETQLSLYEGQVVLLLLGRGDWWFVESREGRRGYVPASYLAKYTP